MAIQREAQRFNWLAAGRRWRKTTMVMSLAVEAATRGGQYIWAAPTFDQVRIGFDETARALGGLARFNIARMTVTIPGRGRIVYRSLDKPDSVRGFSAAGIVIDEASICKPEAYYEILRPMLIDTGGWLWAIFTPKGHNWTHKEHQAAADRDDSAAWQVPTLGAKIVDGQLIRDPHPLENPHIPFSELRQLWADSPERSFRQEILAEFIDSAGGVFNNVDLAMMSADEAAAAARPKDGGEYVIGVDWGRSNDFTVLSVFDISERRQVYVDRFTGIDYELQLSRLKTVAGRYHPRLIIAEKNSMGGPLVERLQQMGLPVFPFTTTNKTKELIIRGLEAAFDHGEIKILPDERQAAELKAFEQQQREQYWKFGAPDGMHDDTVIAMALAWTGISKARPVVLW